MFPLVVPEVNGEDVEWHEGHHFPSPTASTTPLVMAAHPLRELSSPSAAIIADTYQSVPRVPGASLVADLREQSATSG